LNFGQTLSCLRDPLNTSRHLSTTRQMWKTIKQCVLVVSVKSSLQSIKGFWFAKSYHVRLVYWFVVLTVSRLEADKWPKASVGVYSGRDYKLRLFVYQSNSGGYCTSFSIHCSWGWSTWALVSPQGRFTGACPCSISFWIVSSETMSRDVGVIEIKHAFGVHVGFLKLSQGERQLRARSTLRALGSAFFDVISAEESKVSVISANIFSSREDSTASKKRVVPLSEWIIFKQSNDKHLSWSQLELVMQEKFCRAYVTETVNKSAVTSPLDTAAALSLFVRSHKDTLALAGHLHFETTATFQLCWKKNRGSAKHWGDNCKKYHRFTLLLVKTFFYRAVCTLTPIITKAQRNRLL